MLAIKWLPLSLSLALPLSPSPGRLLGPLPALYCRALFDWPVFFATLTADDGGSERTEVSGQITALRQEAGGGGALRDNRVQLSLFPINWLSLCDTSRCSGVNKLTASVSMAATLRCSVVP